MSCCQLLGSHEDVFRRQNHSPQLTQSFQLAPRLGLSKSERRELAAGGNKLARNLPEKCTIAHAGSQLNCRLLLCSIARVSHVNQNICVNGVHEVRRASDEEDRPSRGVSPNFRSTHARRARVPHRLSPLPARDKDYVRSIRLQYSQARSIFRHLSAERTCHLYRLP